MKILSLGAGVQSSTLALMSEKGIIDKPDYAIFADTGWEPKNVYDWLDYLESQITSYPIIRVSKGNIKEDLINGINTGKRFASIPFFTSGGGMSRRQCTNEYKLMPIQKKARELAGFVKYQRIPAGFVEMYIGISTDEVRRMKPSRVKWIVNSWPLIDLGMSRTDCLSWMSNNGYPLPPKSSCIGCPYHSNDHWSDMKKYDLESFADAVDVDAIIRSKGTRKNMDNEEYMHRSLTPLGEVKFHSDFNQESLFDDECEGICGV